MNKPLVSVIVPNYNHEKYLVQRLESIFNQTYQNIEVILMDDCSTDNSLSIFERYKDHEKVAALLFNENNSGNTFKQWVKGIQNAKGELIWIAETDDFCDVHFLEKLVLPFISDEQVVLTYCQSNRVDENGNVTGSWITHTNNLDDSLFQNDFTIDGNEFIERFLIVKNVIPNASAVLFRNTESNLIDFFELSQNLKTCGDWVFYLKYITNKKVAFISDTLNNFRYHSSSVIASTKSNTSLISIIDIDIEMRDSFNSFFRDKKILNFKKILKKNNVINRYNTFDKASIYIKQSQKIRGYFLMLSVLDLYFKHHSLKKRFKNTLEKLFT